MKVVIIGASGLIGQAIAQALSTKHEIVQVALEAMGQDASTGMPAARVAAAYVESVESQRSGEVLDARSF